jgi:hypothetical protein
MGEKKTQFREYRCKIEPTRTELVEMKRILLFCCPYFKVEIKQQLEQEYGHAASKRGYIHSSMRDLTGAKRGL